MFDHLFFGFPQNKAHHTFIGNPFQVFSADMDLKYYVSIKRAEPIFTSSSSSLDLITGHSGHSMSSCIG